ncbi:MAG: choice-of-anchor tandem repeat NxxGxxAF-containing protein [Pirellulales bacterium]
MAELGRVIPDGTSSLEDIVTYRLNDSGKMALSAFLGTSASAPSGVFLSNEGSLTQIAKTGDSTPDGTGSFGRPLIAGFNNSDTVTMFSEVLPSASIERTGVYSYRSGTLSTIAVSGDMAPDGSGALSPAYASASNQSGNAVIEAFVDRPGLTHEYRIYGYDGGMHELARNGQLSLDGDGRLQNPISGSGLNSNNQMLILSELSATRSGLDEVGIYRASLSHGIDAQIVRTGQSLTSESGVVTSVGSSLINNEGTVFYSVGLGSSITSPSTEQLLMRWNGSTSSVIARSGQLAPESSRRFESFTVKAANSSFVVFTSIIDSSSPLAKMGWYATDGIDTLRIQAHDDLIEGRSVVLLQEISDVSINEFGQIAYTAITRDSSSIDSYLFRWTPNLNWRSTVDGGWDSKANWTLGLKPAYVHDVNINTPTDVTVTGPAFSTAVRSLSIGGGLGQSTLDLQPGATLFTTNGVLIKSNGVLTGQGSISGNVTNEGTIVVRDLTFRDSLINTALIRGNGHVAGNIINTSTGTIRVDSGSSIVMDGIGFQNSGNVVVNSGGQLDLQSDLWNSSGSISVQDGGTLVLGGSFTGATASTVSLASEGRALLVGRMDNTGSSTILGKGWSLQGGTVIGGSINATNLAIQSGYMSGVHVTSGLDVDLSSSWLRLSEGSSVDGDIHLGNNGLLIFGQNFALGSGQHLTLGNAGTSNLGYALGEFGNTMYFGNGSTIEGNGWVNFKGDGTSTVIDGTLSPGFSAGTISLVNDIVLGSSSNTIIELGGLSNFDRIDVYGSLLINDGLLDVRLMDGFVLEDGMSFQFLTTFNGSRTGFFHGLAQNSLVGIFGSSRLYIDYTSGDGNDVRLFSITAVPEPSSLALVGLVIAVGILSRRRGKSN